MSHLIKRDSLCVHRSGNLLPINLVRFYAMRHMLICFAGQGTTFAAMDAMLLADVFKGELSPEDWNQRVVEESLKEQKRAVEFASGFLGESPTGWSKFSD